MAGRALATMVWSLTAMNMGSMTDGNTCLNRPGVLAGSKDPLGMVLTMPVLETLKATLGRIGAPAKVHMKQISLSATRPLDAGPPGSAPA